MHIDGKWVDGRRFGGIGRKKGVGNHRSSGSAITAVSMREEGATYEAIAKRLGITRQGAHGLVTRYAKTTHK